MQSNLAAHQHNTARSETLYAILVEGVGPLGSVFSRDDFSDREVKDTDGDGLPEFVDAWGQPLQFFRWPLLYHTDTQRGQVIDYWDYTQTPPDREPSSCFNPPYRSVFEAREQDPLDPNQQLMAPAWWSSARTNANSPFGIHRATGRRRSAAAAGCWPSSTSSTGSPSLSSTPATRRFYWDRGSSLPLPQGLLLQTADRLFGARPATGHLPAVPELGVPEPTATPTAADLITYENNAMPFDPTLFSGETIPAGTTVPVGSTTYQLRENGRDDISNQNRQATGGPGGS